MELIELYDFTFFISRNNSASTIEILKKNKVKGKTLGLSYDYRTSNYERLQATLATTIELLMYSKTARELIFREKWGKTLLEKNNIGTIRNLEASETDNLTIESSVLNFLFIIFFSYNKLYVSSKASTKFEITNLLNEFKIILITGPNGDISKDEYIEQSTESVVSDYCLYRILKSTLEELRVCSKDKENSFVYLMRHMESSLRYFYEGFLNYGKLINTGETDTQLKILEECDSSEHKRDSISGYSELNKLMHLLKEDDFLLMEDVIDELFSFQPSDDYKKEVGKEIGDMGFTTDSNLKNRLIKHMKPFDHMISNVDKESIEGKKIKEINKRFPIDM